MCVCLNVTVCVLKLLLCVCVWCRVVSHVPGQATKVVKGVFTVQFTDDDAKLTTKNDEVRSS